MRVRGMMNDYSQHRVPVTVLFIPERKKRGRKDRANTFLQAECSRKAQHFNAFRVLNWDRKATVFVVFLLTLQPLFNLFQSKRGGKSLMCSLVILISISPSLPTPDHIPTYSMMQGSGQAPPQKQRCGRQSRCAGRSAWGRPAAQG